jgi:hypothetical protein
LTIPSCVVFAAGEAAGADAGVPRRVLRHVVLLKFKDSVTPERVQQLEQDFRTLPGKIDAIIDFEWGKDVSTGERAEGFTHCFRVTFRDEQGRAVYLPHAAHQEFVTAIRSNLEKVLVVDYWTNLSYRAAKQHAEPRRLLRRVVLVKYDEMSDLRAVAGIKTASQTLAGQIKEIHDFECGDDVSVEGLAQGFQHCFCVTFEDEKARDLYLDNPQLKKFISVQEPHVDKALLIEYWASK